MNINKLTKEQARKLIWRLASIYKLLVVNLYDRQDIADTLGIELNDKKFDEFISYCDPASDCEAGLLKVIEGELESFVAVK